MKGENLSIIGVVSAINFAPFVWGLLTESYIYSEILHGFDETFMIATGARTTPIIEISPLTKTPPLETPECL